MASWKYRMINRRSTTLGLTTLVAGGALGLVGCEEPVPSTLKLGVLVPQTGPHAIRGVDLLRGATLAANEINASGFKIAGKPVAVEIVGFDDKGEVDLAVTGARQLVEAGVVAVIGPLNTPQAVKVIPVIAEAGRLNLFTATAANLHDLGRGNTFRLLANDDLQARAVGSLVHETLAAKRIAVLYEPTDYGKGLNRTLLAWFEGVKRVAVINAEIDAKGAVASAVADKIKAENADVVVLLARDIHLKGLYSALQAVGHTKVTVVGTNAIRTRNVAADAMPVSALYATATAIDAQEFGNGPAFVRTFEAAHKQVPVWGAHYAYDAVYLLANSARMTKSMAPKTMIACLKTKEPEARVNDQIRFNETGEQRHAAVAVYRVDRGRWEMQMRSSQW